MNKLKNLIFFLFVIMFCNYSFAKGYNVFGLGYFDIKFDGNSSDEAIDFRYERRFDESLFDLGTKEFNLYELKPFIGIEFTDKSSSYLLWGLYFQDNFGVLFNDKKNNFYLIPSIGIGAYDEGDGKDLGHTIEFRSSIEVSYELKNKNRIGLSLSHISNANIADKNPGVEVLSLSYQIPY